MRPVSNAFRSLLLLAALAAPLAASETIKLKSGAVVKGRATAYDSEKEVLSYHTDDGKDVRYTMDQLDSRSVYLVYASVIPKDNAKGQLQLANFARDAGLYEHAARRYGYAAEDPQYKEQVEKERIVLRNKAADYCLQNARAAQGKGDAKEAQKWLSIVTTRLPDSPQAAEASALLDQTFAREANARDDELEQKYESLLQKDLKRGKQKYDDMLELTRKGLTARNSSQAENHWENAIQDGEDVLKEIDKLLKKYSDDERVVEGASRYRDLTVQQLVELHLHLASSYTTSSSFKKATKEANAALALDPQNAQALSQRARIEQAANEGLIDW